jgi:Beta propeller domain
VTVVARRAGPLVALAALLAVLAMGGPGGGEPATAAPAAAKKPAPALARFASCRGFLAHVRRKARLVVPATGGPRVRVAPTAPEGDRAAVAPQAGLDFSGTNVQEAGVDEPDLVETDGRTVYAIAGGSVRVVDVTGPAPRILAGLTLDGLSPSGLLLRSGRLLVLGDAAVAGGPAPVEVGAVRADAVVAMPLGRPRTAIAQFDVSDPAHPRALGRVTVDGTLVAARLTGTTLRAAVATTPRPIELGRRGALRAGAGAWLPRLAARDPATGRTVRRAAVGCRAVSRPHAFAGLGMVTVLTVDASGPPAVLDSDAILTDGDLVYASPTAMDVATSRWADPALAAADEPPAGTTLIHKLDTSDPARTTYRASGAVSGYLLNQFSMSERDGYLRAAATEEPAWWSGQDETSQSSVTVLAEREGRLAPVGRVGGLGRGERIFAVRFIGDRGYVVTFRQTDPLYALDLSDPARPTVGGALKIPGFSSYLHPVDETTLIGIGQAADDAGRTLGTQVSLFDVSDLSAPRRLAQRALDGDWSEAESDHHAVLWWPATRLLALPITSNDGGAAAVGLTVSRETGITPIARVRHPGTAPVRRALVVGDALYTVSEAGIMAGDLLTLAPRGYAAFD